MQSVVFAAVIAFVTSAFLTRTFSRPDSRFYLLDHPNERSLHTQPTPRSGGVAMILAQALALFTVASLTRDGLWLGMSMFFLAVLSYVDDQRGLSVGIRFVGHVAVAIALVNTFIAPHPLELWPGLMTLWPDWAAQAIGAIFLVGMINIYNFMDGMDGFAGGMALIGFGTLAIFGLQAGHVPYTLICVVVAASAAGFLLFNFPPARIFMGDTGSAVLGLLSGTLLLWGSFDRVFPFWAGFLVFSPFIVDASVTLVRRLVAGEQVWKAHKSHYYQRLVQSGWGHRRTVLAEYGLMLACSASTLLIWEWPTAGQVAVVLGWCATYLLLMLGVERLTGDNNKR